MIRTLLLLGALSAVGLTAWTSAPEPAAPMFGPVDTIPFRGLANDTLGRLAGVPGWGNTRWECQDSVRAGTGTAYVWKVTSGASSGAGTFIAAIDSADAHASTANCHDIVLLHGGFYSPLGGGTRYDNLPYVRISGQTARGEGATFTNYNEVESRGNGAYGKIFEYFRVRSPGTNGGIENIWLMRAVGGTIQRHLSVAWSSNSNNHYRVGSGGTGSVPLLGENSWNHTFHMNISFEPDSSHATAVNMGADSAVDRRIRRATIYQNYFGGPGWRNPLVGANVDTSSVIHNINHNATNWFASMNEGANDGNTFRVDFMGFYAHTGNMGETAMPLRIGQNDSTLFRTNVKDIQHDNNSWEVNAPFDSLVRGSGRVVGCSDNGQETWCNTDDAEVPLEPIFVTDTLDTGPSYAQFAITPFDSTAREVVLDRVGNSRSLSCGGQWSAWGAARDSIDDRAITEFRARGGASKRVNTSAERALGEPADGTACTDTDSDGLPNTYEQSQCGSTTCIPAWDEWVNGRYAGDWYLQGCNLDGTLVGNESTSCGGDPIGPPSPTFGAVSRYVYFVPMQTIFGLSFPDSIPLTDIRFARENAAGDTAMVVTCTATGTPADSATVESRLSAWGLTTLASALAVRDHDPFPGMGC